jgi:rRNA maturation endonuclease Nob1
MEEMECYSCDAVFTVDHDLDTDYYKVKHCPFCGSTVIEEEEDLDFDDYYDEE